MLGVYTFEEEAAMSARNDGNRIPTNAASYHRRIECLGNTVVSRKKTAAALFISEQVSSETLVYSYETARHHIPEDHNLT
jgi:hypothetical protein